MTDNHPITPPPELVQQWLSEYFGTTVTGEVSAVEQHIAHQAARWGADQELEACCEWMVEMDLAASGDIEQLRFERRPKPPTLKEQALTKLAAMERLWEASGNEPSDLVRRALEQLDD